MIFRTVDICFAKIAFIGFLFIGLGSSLQVSEKNGSNYRESNSLLSYVNKKLNKTVLYYDNTTINSNRLYLPVNKLDTEDVLILYNALSRFTHTNDDEVEVKYEGLPFVVTGYYEVNTSSNVVFMVLMTEKKAQLIENRIRAEFAKNYSIIDQENHYTILPGIVLGFDHMKFILNYNYMVVITFQDYLRLHKYSPYLLNSVKYILAVRTITTVPENILICASILKYKHLQTPANVYVMNIAIADILLLALQLCAAICETFITSHMKRSTPLWFIYAYLFPSVLNCICWIVVGITIDRYVAICHPFLGRRISTYSRAVKINITIWALSFIAEFIKVLVDVLYYSYVQSDNQIKLLFSSISTQILILLLPMCIILPAYFCIAMSIWKSSKLRQSCSTNEQLLVKKSIIIAAVIAVQYIFFWAPIASIQLLFQIFNLEKHIFLRICLSILYTHFFLLVSMFNPVLYALISKDFRKAFKDIGLLCIGCIRRLLTCGKRTTPVDANVGSN